MDINFNAVYLHYKHGLNKKGPHDVALFIIFELTN